MKPSPVTSARRAYGPSDGWENLEKLKMWLGSTAGGQRNGWAPVKTTALTKTYRALLLDTEGWFMFNGQRLDVRGKSLGAGVYQVWVELQS